MDDNLNDLFEVGVVIGTHGLRGDLKIRPLPTGNLVLPEARWVFFQDSEGHMVRHAAVRASQHKQNILLRLAGMDNLAAVTPLVGASVWMARSDLPERHDQRFYWFDLEGLEVIDRQLGTIGRVVGMFTTPAHDILEVEGQRGEVLIPAMVPFLVRIDRKKGLLHVDLPEGLVPDADKNP
jgi:16S rRNA processing protein RimM